MCFVGGKISILNLKGVTFPFFLIIFTFLHFLFFAAFSLLCCYYLFIVLEPFRRFVGKVIVVCSLYDGCRTHCITIAIHVVLQSSYTLYHSRRTMPKTA